MMGERRRHNFTKEIREQIRHEQQNRCALCGAETHLTIHHKQPQSEGGPSTRDNAVGLCRTPCDDHIDHLTINKRIPFEQIMERGVSYYLQGSSDRLEQPETGESLPLYAPLLDRRLELDRTKQ